MAVVKSEMQALKDSSRFASLYVGDLSPDVTEEDLIQKFSLTVPVVSVHLCRNSVTGKSMCCAYINFDSPLTASNAIACLNRSDLKGKPMHIRWSPPPLGSIGIVQNNYGVSTMGILPRTGTKKLGSFVLDLLIGLYYKYKNQTEDPRIPSTVTYKAPSSVQVRPTARPVPPSTTTRSPTLREKIEKKMPNHQLTLAEQILTQRPKN